MQNHFHSGQSERSAYRNETRKGEVSLTSRLRGAINQLPHVSDFGGNDECFDEEGETDQHCSPRVRRSSPVSPLALGKSNDARRLGLSLVSMQLKPALEN
jgi:hypothetical protein